MTSVVAAQPHRSADALPLDAFGQYWREVRAVAPLAEGEEQRLLARVAAGRADARTRLVEAYQPWVMSVARRYAAGSTHLTLLDYVQEGNLGLLEAVARYDGRMSDVLFRSWAYWWVRGAMRQAFWRCEGNRLLPEYQARAVARLASAQQELLAALGREPTVDELAGRLGIAVRRALELLLLQQQNIVSLERVTAGEDGVSLAELIPAPAVDGADVGEGSLVGRVRHLVEGLPERERLVVAQRYGFADGVERTQREVADRLGLAHITVEELDRRARLRLRRALERAATDGAAA